MPSRFVGGLFSSACVNVKRSIVAGVALLTVNTGSSSVKLAVYGHGDTLAREAGASVERIGLPGTRLEFIAPSAKVEETIATTDHAGALELALNRLSDRLSSPPRAVGHRLVHGGPDHAEPEPITRALLDKLQALQGLDPTHMPQALAAVHSIGRRFPGVPQFACFDTGFHRSMRAVAQRYPLPPWTHDAGVRRYGFHGLSCESILSQLERADPQALAGRVLIAHLGNGASITAVLRGVSVDTSMGFSPSGGTMMGTRSGDLDPTVMTYLARTRGLTTDALQRLVNDEAGLLGVSGLSQDMRDLLSRASSSPDAAAAIDLYCYTARKHFGALAAALDVIDTIVFTGGIGEHAAAIRQKICEGLGHLGVRLDPILNSASRDLISAANSGVVIRIVETDEDLVIARHVLRLLS
jgi:acetate kinase